MSTIPSYAQFCLFPILLFFTDTATTEIYTLSLHDALPISWLSKRARMSFSESIFSSEEWSSSRTAGGVAAGAKSATHDSDRKSTRLNSSHPSISYAVFCLKKKNKSRDQ